MKNGKRRNLFQINSGSMADIAFLLLIFFLVTTTIREDIGILVKLPVYDESVTPTNVKDKNVLKIKINAANKLWVEGQEMDFGQLKEEVKTFISNPEKLETLPKKPSKAIVSLQNDRGTSYESYIKVYNEIKAAYSELREELSKKRFGIAYEDLDHQRSKIIRNEIPLILSEAEPTEFLKLEE